MATHRINIEITDEHLKDLVITAVEGGFTSTWAEIRSYSPKAGTCEVKERNETGARWREITPIKVAQGLQRAARAKNDEGGWAFAKWLGDRIGDAIIADVILQFAIFNEVKWG